MPLSKEARDARNRYQREWRARNPDKVQMISERYWKNKAKRLKNGDDIEMNNSNPYPIDIPEDEQIEFALPMSAIKRMLFTPNGKEIRKEMVGSPLHKAYEARIKKLREMGANTKIDSQSNRMLYDGNDLIEYR